jgi:DNA topoisomerase-2
MSGLSVIGRDYYGVFPLRGKLLNVREATVKQLAENTEVINLKKILGLKHGAEFKDASDLRYGHVMLMCDADTGKFLLP